MSEKFLKAMLTDLNDIHDDTDEEVRAELEAMGIDVEAAKKSLMEAIRKAKALRDEKKD